MAGPRVFTVEEANSLLPQVEQILRRLDDLRDKLRNLKVRLNALELIWGEAVHEKGNADHREYLDVLRDMKEVSDRFNTEAAGIVELGAVVKSVEPALIDFYGVHAGHLVFLCWQRGEDGIAHWHHVDEGFDGRNPLEG